MKTKKTREAEAMVSWRARVFVKGFMKRHPTRFGLTGLSEDDLYQMVMQMVQEGELEL